MHIGNILNNGEIKKPIINSSIIQLNKHIIDIKMKINLDNIVNLKSEQDKYRLDSGHKYIKTDDDNNERYNNTQVKGCNRCSTNINCIGCSNNRLLNTRRMNYNLDSKNHDAVNHDLPKKDQQNQEKIYQMLKKSIITGKNKQINKNSLHNYHTQTINSLDYINSYISLDMINYFKETKKYNAVKIEDLTQFMPAMPVQKVPAHLLGHGVLGRCYTGTNLIQIRDDLEGADFKEVYVHELKHAISPHMSEYSVRFWTKALMENTKYN